MSKSNLPPPSYSQYSTPADYGAGGGVVPPQPTGYGVQGSGAVTQPPPPPGYPMQGGGSVPPPPPPGMVTTTGGYVGATTVVVGAQPRRIFSKHPTSVVCQHCNTNVVTQPRAEVGLTTWAIAGIMILLGLWLGCCLIPFCIDECKDIHHDCPNCHKTVEIYKHM